LVGHHTIHQRDHLIQTIGFISKKIDVEARVLGGIREIVIANILRARCIISAELFRRVVLVSPILGIILIILGLGVASECGNQRNQRRPKTQV
jgi:hypothetical protein